MGLLVEVGFKAESQTSPASLQYHIFPMHNLLFVVIFSLAINCKDTVSQYCDSTDVDCVSESQANSHSYKDPRWQKYLKKIENANASYKECTYSNCSCFERWREDLDPFKSGITQNMVKEAKERSVHFQIINHRLYRQEKCMFGPRCEGVQHFLLEIINELPDMEFALNDRDYPLSNARLKPKPIFSFSKTKDNFDIMYPAWSFWSGGPAISLHPTGIGRWDLLRQSINIAAQNTLWDRKFAKAFFRGSRTSSERDPLILLSRNQPSLVEAKYTKNQAWKSEKDTLGEEPAKEMHFEDHCKYKYLFNFRGVAASFRLKHLFLCGSTVFHVGNEWKEFFYDALKPWIHYVPVSSDLSELEELLEFAQKHDSLMQKIAQRGRDFIWDHLRLEDVSCYWKTLLTEYAALLRYKVKPDPNLIEIKK